MSFRCLAAKSRSEVVGYLPFFELRKGPLSAVWSLPFGTYGGPVVRDDEEVRRSLLESYAALRKARRVQEVGLVDFSNTVPTEGYDVEDTSTHVVDLSGGFEKIWGERFEKSKRRQTRKAAKEGLAVAESRSVADVSLYYGIYGQRVDRWRERFRYPERIFADLVAGGAENVRLFLARRGEDVLGGHLNFYFKESVVAWNGVVRDTADGTQASTLLYSECMRHACENGFRAYNLGSSLGKSSLVDYKVSLGGVAYGYRTLRWRSAAGKVAGTVRKIVSGR
jgi:hypothetical protein